VSDLRAVNTRLRQVVADKDERIAALEALVGVHREQLETQDQLIKGQARQLSNQDEMLRTQSEQIDGQSKQIAAQAELIRQLRAEVAELRRRQGTDSTNASVPPSKDSIAVKAQRRADRSSRERSAERKPGGQPGRQGNGLTATPDPDRTERVDPPAECRDCCADLTGATELPDGWAQVWDVLPAVVAKTHYELPRRRCGCGTITTAAPPFGSAGTVAYGPNLNAAAILLGSEGNVPVERTAMLLEALLGVEVSTGFVARAASRLADKLNTAGFDEAMTAALRAEDVLCGDESPVNVLANDLDNATGEPVAGAPHAVTLRTPDSRLIWYTAMPSRSKDAIAELGVLEDWHGFLVRDDYVGWHQFDAHLAGVQQCVAHLIRHCKGVLELHPDWQKWADTVIQVLRDTAKAVDKARAAGADQLDPELLAQLRQRYDKAVAWGITTNRHRDWHKGNHPGFTLAQRLKDKADQVWLFAKNFKIPWTNNAAEQALRNPKRHQAVSGYWRTTDTLRADLRVRSYLASARAHGIRAIDAIHHALTGNPWLPAVTA
jgi:transposase